MEVGVGPPFCHTCVSCTFVSFPGSRHRAVHGREATNKRLPTGLTLGPAPRSWSLYDHVVVPLPLRSFTCGGLPPPATSLPFRMPADLPLHFAWFRSARAHHLHRHAACFSNSGRVDLLGNSFLLITLHHGEPAHSCRSLPPPFYSFLMGGWRCILDFVFSDFLVLPH